MVTRLRWFSKVFARLVALISVLWLAACDLPSGGGPVINTGKAVPVALLVPATAPDNGALLAANLENAARLAMQDLAGANIDLRVYDTGGNATQAAAMATKAVNEGARIIIGPVFAESSTAAGRAVAGRGVNVLSFSNNTAIAGGNVFVLGNTFENITDRLTRYAVASGRGDIYIVNATTPAEEIGRAAIESSIRNNGARLAGVSSFEATQQGVVDAIPGIAGSIKSSGASSVFLTSGTAGALSFLANLLPENGLDVTQTQMIGLQRLDIPASALALSGLQGAWFATPDPGLTAQFSARYQAAYGGTPHPLAGMAYDAIAAIGALVANGNSDALTAAALTQPSGFAGVGGVFRLRRDGTNERALAVAQIQNQQVIVLDPAPRRFGSAGF